MAKPLILIRDWLPEGTLDRWRSEFPDFDWVDAREPTALEEYLPRAVIAYALPPIERLEQATHLRWIQLMSAGVPPELCPAAKARGITVSNLSGLYGVTIAEHALALMLILSRNLHVAVRNQLAKRWDKDIAKTMVDLHGKTVGLVGLGDIGRQTARLCRTLGMRVHGCRRKTADVPGVDRVYPLAELHIMLAEVDFLVVTAPLTAQTEGMLGTKEFAALKPGVIFINVSRGAVADEAALLAALRSGQVAAAGLDAYTVEPLPAEHPFWTLPQVLVSPHYSGDTVNQSSLPAERFARNLRRWQAGQPLEGLVDLDWGY